MKGNRLGSHAGAFVYCQLTVSLASGLCTPLCYDRAMKILFYLLLETRKLYPSLSVIDLLIAGLEELCHANRMTSHTRRNKSSE